MKSVSKNVFIILFLSSIAVPQTKGRRTTKGGPNKPSAAVSEQTLRDLELRWNEAFKNRDKAALDRILDDHFVFTGDDGQFSDKTQYVDAAMQAIEVESYKIDDVTVRVYGDTGVVAGRWTGKFTVNGKDASGDFRFTDTFARRPGGWKLVASQDTRMPRKGVQLWELKLLLHRG